MYDCNDRQSFHKNQFYGMFVTRLPVIENKKFGNIKKKNYVSLVICFPLHLLYDSLNTSIHKKKSN